MVYLVRMVFGLIALAVGLIAVSGYALRLRRRVIGHERALAAAYRLSTAETDSEDLRAVG